MNELKIEQLGKVIPGDEDAEKHLFKLKEPRGDFMLKRKTCPAPIVLWGRDSWASVLYYVYESRNSTGEVNQKIDFLARPGKGVMGHLNSLTGAYPIKVRCGSDKDRQKTNGIWDFFTADVNGDGVEELIVIRSFGNIEVYDREKRIASTPPPPMHHVFEYKLDAPQIIKLADHDEVFFTIHRETSGSVELMDKQKKYDGTTRNSWVIRLSPQGITEIYPRFKDHTEPLGLDTAVPLNRPGSNKVDELVVLSEIKGVKETCLSRHDLTGKAIDVPRQIYVDYDMYCKNYFSFPQSNQISIENGQDDISYFITPDKPVNWINTIRLKDIFGRFVKDVKIIGKSAIDNLAVEILMIGEDLLILDAKGKFHTSMKPGDRTSDKPVLYMSLNSDSDLHDIIKVIPTDKTMESFLVIQNREPSKRKLPLKELESAGKKFLSDSDWKTCRDKLNLSYVESDREFVEWYCKKNKIKMPTVHSLEDIKKKLPGYYKEMVQDSLSRYEISLNTRLLGPLEKGGYDVDQSDYKKKEEYRKWLDSVFIPPELVLSIQHRTMGILGHKNLSDYYYEKMDTGGIYLPNINVKASGEHGAAVMVLQKKILNKDFDPGFYSVTW